MKFILKPYRDPASGLDWNEQTPIIVERISKSISESEYNIKYKTSESEHGKGADLPTITLEIVSSGIVLFFAIPAIHKKIREALSEWKLIYTNLNKFIDWLSKKEPIVLYPPEILFLDALSNLDKETDVLELEIIDVTDSPKAYEGMLCPEGLTIYLFTFKSANSLYQVAVNNNREVLWCKKYNI